MKTNIAFLNQSNTGGIITWTVTCPYCGDTHTWAGNFDLNNEYRCDTCALVYKVSGLYNHDGSKIQ